MQYNLIEKLKSYIVVNNPDLLVSLQEGSSLRQYLEDKVESVLPYAAQLLTDQRPQYVIEELCMNRLTEDLRPSRYNYLYAILAEEFHEKYAEFSKAGIVTYELLNVLDSCK